MSRPADRFLAVLGLTLLAATASARPAAPVVPTEDEASFSDFSFGVGAPFVGATEVAGVNVVLTTTQTEPFGASSFRDDLTTLPADVLLVFDSPISEFHLDVSFVRPDEYLTDFNLGSPSALSGTLVNQAGFITTSGSDDHGFGRLSWFGISTNVVSLTIGATGAGPIPALAVDQFGFDTPGGQLALCADVASISLTGGGQQVLSLSAGGAQAGSSYWMFGSISGTTPGIDFGGGVVLPLNFDGYFNLTLSSPGFAAFGDFVGTLDGAGAATATLTAPPGATTALAGLTLQHAYLASSSFPVPTFASNAVPVLLVP